jgi:cytochrome c556
MKKRLLLAGFALAFGAGYTLTAFSQVKPEILVKQRQAAMTLQGKYAGPLGGMAAGKVPYNAETAALPAIWSEPAKFKEAQDNFQKAVQALVAVSRGGDEAAQKSAIGAVGKACGACHQDFREKQN